MLWRFSLEMSKQTSTLTLTQCDPPFEKSWLCVYVQEAKKALTKIIKLLRIIYYKCQPNTIHFGLKSVQYLASVTWNNIPDSSVIPQKIALCGNLYIVIGANLWRSAVELPHLPPQGKGDET